MTKPTFLGIGVPRSGTTWLHSTLAAHPDVYMPTRRKEVRFFDQHFEHGLAWYEAFFCPSEEEHRYRAIGEISPQYFYCAECAERIAATLPEVRLILMLRHPVERAYSTYGFTVQRANYRGSFEEFVSSRPSVLERGFYSRYLAHYARHFEREQICTLIFERAIADADYARPRLAEFLGIDPHRFPDEGRRGPVNASSVPVSQRLSRLAVKTGRRMRRWRLEAVVDLGRRLGVQRLIQGGRPLPRLESRLRDELTRLYDEEFDELEESWGIDVGWWRRTGSADRDPTAGSAFPGRPA